MAMKNDFGPHSLEFPMDDTEDLQDDIEALNESSAGDMTMHSVGLRTDDADDRETMYKKGPMTHREKALMKAIVEFERPERYKMEFYLHPAAGPRRCDMVFFNDQHHITELREGKCLPFWDFAWGQASASKAFLKREGHPVSKVGIDLFVKDNEELDYDKAMDIQSLCEHDVRFYRVVQENQDKFAVHRLIPADGKIDTSSPVHVNLEVRPIAALLPAL